MSSRGICSCLPASMQQYSSHLKACSIADADLTTEILLAWRKGKQPPEIQDFFSLHANG